uniref:Uncharacterized protein n=1 Tax=Photinus pyralis TaxID=7054 RepID=A0A1Y1LGQ1_PHOPY
MAPLCKVSLVEVNEFDDGESIHSGPHSMLFGIKDGLVGKDLERIDVNETFVSSGNTCEGEPSNLPKSLIRSDTYESIQIPEKNPVNRTLIKSDTYDKSEEDCGRYNNTYDVCDTNECEISGNADETLSYLNENNFPDIVNSTRISAKSEDRINETITHPAPLVTKDKRRVPKSLTCVPCTSSSLNSTLVYSESKVKKTTYTSSPAQRTKTTQISDSGKNLNDTFVGEPKLKCLKLHGIESQNLAPLTHPTQLYSEADIENSLRRRRVKGTPTYSPATDDDNTKRNSLEFEESLGILTPEQMTDFSAFPECRSLSSENISALPTDFQNFQPKYQSETKPPEMSSPNLPDVSIKDLSLGIIDENMLLSFAIKSDATNLELPLDSLSKSKSYAMARLEQTPSPEDLPLDPTPVIECDSKSEQTKSKTTSNSFITSITSITSLDTGYQGDGEMSRPASRGADHSPLTRRPMPRPQPRRPDPLTDSDFYTESDADNHEEPPLRGDRLARIIDGTLYGVDPQAAADIYVNNRENMDSSGIFTDIEGNTRTDELSSAENENVDVSPSPSDTSSKTISNDSQNNAPALLNKTITKTGSATKPGSAEKKEKSTEMQLKGKSPTPSTAASSPASVRSPRHTPREDSASKKYKMPKRNVASKVKAVLQSSTPPRKENATNAAPKKTVGRWDAVMNKITKNPSSFKEIKSKVFTNNSPTPPRPNVTPNNKLRRTRARSDTTITKINNAGSLHSSASDLSGASPPKRIGSAKKRSEVVRVTQVLTASKLSPRSVHQNTLAENKKNVAKLSNDVKTPPRKILFTQKDKKPTSTVSTKDGTRATVKGGRASPGARPPQLNRVPTAPISRTTEALAVLVQHLVFNLEAFQTPSLKKQIEKNRMIAEEAARFSCRQMEEHIKEIEGERAQYRKDIEEIVEQHRNDIMQLKRQHLETEQELISEHENIKRQLSSCHNEQLLKLRVECNKLQKSHGQSLDILREENDSIREEIDDKNALIAKLEKEKEKQYKEFQIKEKQYKEKLNLASDEISSLKSENLKLMSYVSAGKENKLQLVLAEVESLRAVLELKQTDIADLRKLLAQSNQKAELVPRIADKVSVLSARCEDLESQLESKSGYEQQLLMENRKLQESLKEEMNHSVRLRQHNEELQWKVQQNKEVVSRVIEETSFSRCLHNSYDRDLSDSSPPSSPKVKGVVEKSDSVSYVLEIEESPQIIASRIVRRSFRNSTPPKTSTPSVKCMERSSKSSISDVSSIKYDHSMDLEDFNDDDIQLPPLPSEIGQKSVAEALPVPKKFCRGGDDLTK